VRKTIFFDLDGTLLPMDQDVFTNEYFRLLIEALAPLGHSAETLTAAVWKGTGAMVRNDGRRTNEAVFWDTYAAILGEEARADLPAFERFYERDFIGAARNGCTPGPEAAAGVAELQRRGYRLVLATNPLFPMIAQTQRLEWAGLRPDNFVWITSYENSRFCKPNPDYYREILTRLSLRPEDCMMVGNDVGEDMIAETLGMRVFLMTRCLINRDGRDISAYPQGGFPELLDHLDRTAF